MKRRTFLAGLAVAGVLPLSSCRCSGDAQPSVDAGAPASGDAGDATPTLTEQSFELGNGLAVDLSIGPCGDTVGIALLLAVGIDHDPKGRSGMAHLNERVLRASLAPGRPNQAVETSEAYTLYSTNVASDAVLGELDAIAKWLTQVPSDADLDRERGQVLAELAKREGVDAAATARSLAEESLRPTRSGGKRRGVAEHVERVTVGELQSFWREHFKAGNARLVIVGSVDAQAVRAHLDKVFAPIPRGTPPELGEENQATVKGTLVMGDAPTAVAIAVPAPDITSPAFPAFLVLAARLLREPEKPRDWTAEYDPLRRPELLFITGAVAKGEQPEPAATRIRKEVGALIAAPLSPDDALRTQRRFQLFILPELSDPLICAEDPRAFALARARRRQLEPAPKLDAAAAALDEARALFGKKGSAAVIAGGALPGPATTPEAEGEQRQ